MQTHKWKSGGGWGGEGLLHSPILFGDAPIPPFTFSHSQFYLKGFHPSHFFRQISATVQKKYLLNSMFQNMTYTLYFGEIDLYHLLAMHHPDRSKT